MKINFTKAVGIAEGKFPDLGGDLTQKKVIDKINEAGCDTLAGWRESFCKSPNYNGNTNFTTPYYDFSISYDGKTVDSVNGLLAGSWTSPKNLKRDDNSWQRYLPELTELLNFAALVEDRSPGSIDLNIHSYIERSSRLSTSDKFQEQIVYTSDTKYDNKNTDALIGETGAQNFAEALHQLAHDPLALIKICYEAKHQLVSVNENGKVSTIFDKQLDEMVADLDESKHGVTPQAVKKTTDMRAFALDATAAKFENMDKAEEKQEAGDNGKATAALKKVTEPKRKTLGGKFLGLAPIQTFLNKNGYTKSEQ